jgi:hypothetical protein
MKKWFIILLILSSFPGTAEDKGKEFYLRGALYQDWMGFKSGDNDFYNRLSSRLHLTLWNRPGEGWTAFIDVRSRFTLVEGGKNQLMMYDVRFSYDSLKSKFFFSLGQMNLYDTAGIGQLTGAAAGYKLNKYLLVGGYGGLEPDIYNTRWDFDYRKFGIFTRYIGPGAKQFSFSYNRLLYHGQTERQFIYTSVLLPIKEILVLYGNMEYELDPGTKSEDRLSRLFVNARVNLTRYADVTANYSSGRGLDYHRYLLEQSQDPTIGNNEIERYYYNETYGIRLSIKPVKNLRLYASRRESEQKDLVVRNHTTGFGISVVDMFRTGFSLYGNYNMNRGDASESDSYYISASRSFGKLSWNISYASYYNGVRFIDSGTPQVFHLPDQRTVSSGFFLVLNRSLALSLDYTYSDQSEYSDHQFFVRVIYRK